MSSVMRGDRLGISGGGERGCMLILTLLALLMLRKLLMQSLLLELALSMVLLLLAASVLRCALRWRLRAVLASCFVVRCCSGVPWMLCAVAML